MATGVIGGKQLPRAVTGRLSIPWPRGSGQYPVVSLTIFGLFLVCGVLGPLIAPHDPLAQDLRQRLAPPFWESGGSFNYPLGTDELGRDILSRIMVGARISLLVAGGGLLLSVLSGAAIGFAAGYFGGSVDTVVMRIVDAGLALPSLLFALIFAVTLGPGMGTVMLVIGVTTWPRFARMMRAEALMLRSKDYVKAARIAGVGDARILFVHIVPNSFNTLLVLVTLSVGNILLLEASLSFLGAGIPLPTPSWGSMTSEGRDYLTTRPWNALLPGIAIMLVVLASNYLGDWIRERVDPRLRQL
jgi:peptide/nickel transport system permease protein